MNATCPAGIPKPQRVSDLGRLLNPEITAPLDSTAVDVVTPTSAWRLAICKAPSPRHVRGNSPWTHGPLCVTQLPRRSTPSKTWRFQRNVAFSHLALRDGQLPHQDRRRPLRVPFGTPRPTTCTSRPVRHDAVGASFAIHRQVLLPAFHYHFRHELQTSRAIRDHGLRANQTTAHDETSRARRQDLQTAPCASTARCRHRLARTAAIRGRVPDQP